MKFNNKRTLAESVVARGLDLSESSRWKDYSVAIREGYKAKNKTSIPENILATTATLLENTYQYCNRMDETTREVNLGSFVDYGFDVISATVPNLIAHELVSVQPMNAKHGAIFYLQYLYGSNKGSIAAGSDINSPFTGHAGTTHDDYINFSGDTVNGESLGTGDNSTVQFGSINLGYTPVETRFNMTLHVGTSAEVIAVSGTPSNGVYDLAHVSGTALLASSGSSLNPETGAITVKFASAPATGAKISLDYRYNMERTEVGFSQVDIDLASVSIEAFPRKLRARWLLDAGFELQKMKGIDAESELVTMMSNEIKFEIDGELLSEMYRQAGNTVSAWDAKMPGTYLSYSEYKKTIIDVFTEASNAIFQATKRTGANFIVAGVNVCNIIETLEEFKADNLGTKQINGPHKIGTLAGKWTVYKNPFYADNNYLLGYKGTSWLDAGYVYAPYMPLYTTPTQVLDDFIFRKGLATSYGKVMLNDKLYAKGSISNFDASRMTNSAISAAVSGTVNTLVTNTSAAPIPTQAVTPGV